MHSLASITSLLLQGLLVAAQTTITSTGNPILADGSYYSADPAPLVVNNTVYILSGRDTAPANQNAFVMNEWQMFSSSDPRPSGAQWQFRINIARPESIFSWATSGSAFAAQVVQGRNGRFYLYAPVNQRSTSSPDRFAIGVAVSSNPWGPFTDAHPSGPIISQTVPQANNIQNIDPSVLVDDNGRVYLYWGTFGQLRGIELATDMVTTIGSAISVNSLTGFFEGPWLMKRQSTYYMLYAANNAGSNSPCTPTSYHACIAYGTASSPLGPWTFRGVVLDIVSSTTSHPGVFQLNGQWYLVYHTRDANGGGHFRRSIAIDYLNWDDGQSPARINKVVQTRRQQPAAPATRNIAPRAVASSVNQTPIQYWTKSLNDGWIPGNPLPPDYWSSYNGNASPQTNTLVLTWSSAVTLNGARMVFFADQPAGSNIGVPPPANWRLEYLNSNNAWVSVSASTGYPTAVTDNPSTVNFAQISTRSLRAILTASGGNGQFGGVGVKEFEALAPNPQ
ncbi:glycosyl hydrolase family 43 protein (xylosidase/arabinosidase) [Colletotrichum truncatum]|uniref:Glycosyl hydrolase family 43 protein (Xylosidase/arabinosidase) n=1 Tax=Colletotrichum truncatum TaxID=5467 RepID=A0ACC3Z8Y9_COLTU|nr:glycosyl hydrolase family 43 protein (xylosidase/arabinosidase) [Colletotrichum truncatum]KAF6780560.1 glycosyl hydrolase family 43 protein (xylosidase/arabinosidase) [Colletotrichum truncatum]